MLTENFISETVGFLLIGLAVWAIHYLAEYKMQKLLAVPGMVQPGLFKAVRIYGTFLLGLSMILFFIAAFQFYDDVRFYFSGQKSNALVVQGFPDHRFEYSYTFQTHSAEVLQGKDDYVRGCDVRRNCSPVKGEKIIIEYLPSSPDTNRIVYVYFSPMMLFPFLFLYWGRKFKSAAPEDLKRKAKSPNKKAPPL